MSLVVVLPSVLDEPVAVAAEVAAAIPGRLEEVRADARVNYSEHISSTDWTSFCTYSVHCAFFATDGTAANSEFHARTDHAAEMLGRDLVTDAAPEPGSALVGHPLLQILHWRVGDEGGEGLQLPVHEPPAHLLGNGIGQSVAHPGGLLHHSGQGGSGSSKINCGGGEHLRAYAF